MGVGVAAADDGPRTDQSPAVAVLVYRQDGVGAGAARAGCVAPVVWGGDGRWSRAGAPNSRGDRRARQGCARRRSARRRSARRRSARRRSARRRSARRRSARRRSARRRSGGRARAAEPGPYNGTKAPRAPAAVDLLTICAPAINTGAVGSKTAEGSGPGSGRYHYQCPHHQHRPPRRWPRPVPPPPPNWPCPLMRTHFPAPNLRGRSSPSLPLPEAVCPRPRREG